MNHFICPLCCQQDFKSIIALREHLLYYIYRPITCPICNLSVGGIHGLTKHLELHHIDNKQVPFSDNNFQELKDIDYRTSKLNVKDSLLPFFHNSRASDVLSEKSSFKNADLNADRPVVLSLDVNRPIEEHTDLEQRYNISTMRAGLQKENEDLSSKYETVPQRKGLELINCSDVQLSTFSIEASQKRNSHYVSESSTSCDFSDLNNSAHYSSTLDGSASLFESLSPKHVPCNKARIADYSNKFDGFQALSADAVRAFVCITCGAKIVGKDIYFKHIQGKCSHDEIELSKVSRNKSEVNKVNNLLGENFTEESTVKTSTSHSLFSCHSENNLLEKSSSSSEFYLNKGVETDKPESRNVSKRLIDGNYEMYKEEIRPYIHKKFDHDQERKVAKVPSSDVQCYIQNFQSLLVDKLNKTLESDNNKLPFIKTMENTNFFEAEMDINFKSPSIDCDGNKSSPVASLCTEKVETVSKDGCVKPLAKNKAIRCKFCPKTFSKPYLLLRHQQEFHSSITYYCNLCGNHFKSKRTLANHRGTHKEKNFLCTKCDYSCFTASGLRTHVFENHSKKRKKNYLCTLCPETFKKKYGLDRHIKRRHENNRILCQFCDKLFACKEDLNLHMTIHLNDKSLTCNYCGKLFTSLSSLKRHKSTHNSKRESFKCNKCSKMFTRKDSLQSHFKLHE